jgi:hypothetical protein
MLNSGNNMQALQKRQQHEMHLRKLDIRRREHRAEFNIKQRDKIIEHLKEQLQLRDQIIKEKFGVSISNFLPNKEEAQKN